MNAEMIEAAKADNATTETPATPVTVELPQVPVKFDNLCLEKFENGEPFISGYNPELKVNIRIDDDEIKKALHALGARPDGANGSARTVPTNKGLIKVESFPIRGYAIVATVTAIFTSGKTATAYIKDATPIKTGLELKDEWAVFH